MKKRSKIIIAAITAAVIGIIASSVIAFASGPNGEGTLNGKHLNIQNCTQECTQECTETCNQDQLQLHEQNCDGNCGTTGTQGQGRWQGQGQNGTQCDDSSGDQLRQRSRVQDQTDQ